MKINVSKDLFHLIRELKTEIDVEHHLILNEPHYTEL